MRVIGNEEAPHIAQYHHDVLVYGVDMKQVVLHLSHDVSEDPQIAAQHRSLVHQSKCMRNAIVLLKNFKESCSIDRVFPELCIHHIAHVE